MFSFNAHHTQSKLAHNISSVYDMSFSRNNKNVLYPLTTDCNTMVSIDPAPAPQATRHVNAIIIMVQ
jgi:hypothetical protein